MMDNIFDFFAFFSQLSPNPTRNIDIIVKQAAEITGAACAAYEHFNARENRFWACAGYHLPPGFGISAPPESCICFEPIARGKDKPVILEDLEVTSYFENSPVIRKFGFKSFMGLLVRSGQEVCGSLCVLDVRKRTFSPEDIDAITLLGKALSLEEERNRVRKDLKTRLSCEEMLVDISNQAIFVEDVHGFLDECLERMGRTMNVEGIFFWEYDAPTQTVSNISEWLSEGYPSQKENLQNIPMSAFPWGMELMTQNNIMRFGDIDDIPEGKEKDIMRMMGIKSILMIPHFIKGTFHGTMRFEVYSRRREWLDEDIHVLKAVSQIITKSIEHFLAEKAILKTNSDLERRVKERTTELQATTEELLLHQSELERVNKQLLATNNALSILARNIEKSKEEIEKKVAQAVRSEIIPILAGLKKAKMLERHRGELDVIAARLGELVKGMGSPRGIFASLSAKEARIAAMIKNNLKSREIARELNISTDTVKTHRRNIRRKLGIQNDAVNLTNYLKSKWQEEE